MISFRWFWRIAAFVIQLAYCAGCEGGAPGRYKITSRFPHDATAYTQGLLAAGGVLFESTGRYGESQVRRVDLESGVVLAAVQLPADRFGEGLALFKGRLYQLTWKSGIAYVYDPGNLALLDSIRYAGEGWGLTADNANLIMSDGSDSLRFVDPRTFQTERVVHVRLDGAPLVELNELELVDGEIFANVYQTNWVVRIDPATGVVHEAIDFGDLYPTRPSSADVMNGIALAPDGKHLLLTGKLWPILFQVRLR